LHASRFVRLADVYVPLAILTNCMFNVTVLVICISLYVFLLGECAGTHLAKPIQSLFSTVWDLHMLIEDPIDHPILSTSLQSCMDILQETSPCSIWMAGGMDFLRHHVQPRIVWLAQKQYSTVKSTHGDSEDEEEEEVEAGVDTSECMLLVGGCVRFYQVFNLAIF